MITQMRSCLLVPLGCCTQPCVARITQAAPLCMCTEVRRSPGCLFFTLPAATRGAATLPPPHSTDTGSGVWEALFAAPEANMPQAERRELLVEENAWKNDLVMWMFPASLRESTPQWVHSYLRCLIMTYAVYLGVGAAWVYYAYVCFGDKLYAPGTIPARADILAQVKVRGVGSRAGRWVQQWQLVAVREQRLAAAAWGGSLHAGMAETPLQPHTSHFCALAQVSLWAIPLYSGLPVLTEWFAEQGWTQVRAGGDVGAAHSGQRAGCGC